MPHTKGNIPLTLETFSAWLDAMDEWEPDEPETGKSLTQKRPFLTESPARVAPMESENVQNIEVASAKILSFPDMRVRSPSGPADRPRRTYAVLSATLDSVALAGAPGCAPAMLRADQQFERINDRDARVLLRIRCGRCKVRCEAKLPPISVKPRPA
jgi:hypothetical protein